MVERERLRAVEFGADYPATVRIGRPWPPSLRRRIRQAARHGARLIVIDPRRIELTDDAACHLAIRPGWLAAENLMLAASAMGLGSCCIGSATAALDAAAIKEELGIPGDFTAVAPIIVGVPRETPTADQRKPPEILSWT